MLKHFTFYLSLLLILQAVTSILAITNLPFNISHFVYPKTHVEHRPQPSLFLKDVLGSISDKQKWDLEEIRVSKLDLRKAKYGSLQKYEVGMKLGKGKLVIKLFDEEEFVIWRKFNKGEGGDFEDLVKEIVGSKAVIDAFRVEGPVELRVAGDDELSLNTKYNGLKRIVVGEGVAVEVRGAQEVSLFHTSDLRRQLNRSAIFERQKSDFESFWNSVCMPSLPLRILGSASVIVHKTQNHYASIETAFLSRETIKLLPDKCYVRHTHKNRGCPIDSLCKRIALLEKLFRSPMVAKTNHNAGWGFVKSKIKASTIFRFQLEIERNVGNNDTTIAEWRTRPTIERGLFEVVAKIESERLKPLMIKKVRPVVVVESSAWSNVMSNISFTQIPSLLVPPEALTLDVKW